MIEAERLCTVSSLPECVNVVSSRAWQEMGASRYDQAQTLFERALESARASGDPYREANVLLDLSNAADEQEHFDQALDWAGGAQRISLAQDFATVAESALGNMGFAYYRLGNHAKAEAMFKDAIKQAERVGHDSDQGTWLQNLGYIYLDAHKFDAAEAAYQRAFNLAQHTNNDDLIDALIALAFVCEQTGRLEKAKSYAGEALVKARENNNSREQLYSRLVQGRVAARLQDYKTAETSLNVVARSGDSPDSLKWEAEHSLARVYEDQNQFSSADREYQVALDTFEKARSGVQDEDSRLPFLTNASRIYDDYINFLIAKGKTDEALRVAEFSRGRTLAEGLGLLKKGTSFNPDPVNATTIAGYAGGTILFYALGDKQSHLWAITAQQTKLFPLKATRSEIDVAVQRYRTKIEGSPGILEASTDGSTLYQMLVAPAEEILKKALSARNNRVFIVPDGSLNSLNFETLTPQPKHYWIEDVTITNAGSLRMLSASRARPAKLAGGLLLMGNPVPPKSGAEDIYPKLPNSGAEMAGVEKYFPEAQRQVLSDDQATPSAYVNGHPEQFSYIHFVAHGTASSTSPLDSAIILSRENASKAATKDDDSFKLYAREIIRHPLKAELVTISACYSQGNRAYSGEGLVGLSWAFLRSGAHQVVGALWDVSDTSVTQLMDEFYGGLQKGKSPDAALRAAKLSLLHSANPAYHRPFYWAPFQLYTGS